MEERQPHAANIAPMQRWRRVASTHRLEDLWDPASKPPWSTAFTLWVGLALLLGSMTAAVAGSAWFIRVGIPGAPSSLVFYVQLVISCFPVTFLGIALNWFCIKLFKHNT
jgi:hypothetical protein